MSLEAAKDYAFTLIFVPVALFNYGGTYTIDKFIELVKNKYIVDYDGLGYAAFEIEGQLYEHEKMEVHCDADWLEARKKQGITHIRWYNK